MTRDDINQAVTASLEDRVRDAIKGVLEEVMDEEMTAQLQARHRERTEQRRGERNGYYGRALTTAAGHIEQIRVPRAREAPFLTEVFERYRRMSGSLEEAVLEMYLQGVSTRKVEQVTGKLSGTRISKDAVSRIAGRLGEDLAEWRTRRFENAYPYLYLDATYLKVRWAGSVRDLALLTAIGVNDRGHREVLAALGPPQASARRPGAACFKGSSSGACAGCASSSATTMSRSRAR